MANINEIPISQTWYSVILDTQNEDDPEFQINLDDADTIEMMFMSPAGVLTKLEAERIGTTSQIVYELPTDKTVLNELGKWAVWPYITDDGGRVAQSKKAVAIYVIEDGQTT